KNNHILSNDLFSLLVKANENLPDDEKLDHDELISQVKTILLNRLREELSNVFSDLDHHPTADEIDKLKYFDCVLKETLRLVPPVPSLVRKNHKR
ncbi:12853_t:CDS:2, partial [Cetraspora pellucida]